jgi:hypothetical protein
VADLETGAVQHRDHPAGAKTTKIKCLALAAVPMFPKAGKGTS